MLVPTIKNQQTVSVRTSFTTRISITGYSVTLLSLVSSSSNISPCFLHGLVLHRSHFIVRNDTRPTYTWQKVNWRSSHSFPILQTHGAAKGNVSSCMQPGNFGVKDGTAKTREEDSNERFSGKHISNSLAVLVCRNTDSTIADRRKGSPAQFKNNFETGTQSKIRVVVSTTTFPSFPLVCCDHRQMEKQRKAYNAAKVNHDKREYDPHERGTIEPKTPTLKCTV
jgi:hypothetical protein